MARIPLHSLRFPTEDSSAAARELLYLSELDRQARLANWCLGQAVVSAGDQDDNFTPWAFLQGGMFAAIIVQRLLQPVRVLQAYPQHTKAKESQDFADERGRRLRTLLDIPDDSPLLAISAVRNAFEHFDEGLDIATRPEVVCFSDWYITDAHLLKSTTHEDGATVGLRTYAPTAGLLWHESNTLDLFALDEALYELRAKIAEQRGGLEARIRGCGRFGGGLMTALDEKDVLSRMGRWLAMRELYGEPVAVRLTPTE